MEPRCAVQIYKFDASVSSVRHILKKLISGVFGVKQA